MCELICKNRLNLLGNVTGLSDKITVTIIYFFDLFYTTQNVIELKNIPQKDRQIVLLLEKDYLLISNYKLNYRAKNI